MSHPLLDLERGEEAAPRHLEPVELLHRLVEVEAVVEHLRAREAGRAGRTTGKLRPAGCACEGRGEGQRLGRARGQRWERRRQR